MDNRRRGILLSRCWHGFGYGYPWGELVPGDTDGSNQFKDRYFVGIYDKHTLSAVQSTDVICDFIYSQRHCLCFVVVTRVLHPSSLES